MGTSDSQYSTHLTCCKLFHSDSPLLLHDGRDRLQDLGSDLGIIYDTVSEGVDEDLLTWLEALRSLLVGEARIEGCQDALDDVL